MSSGTSTGLVYRDLGYSDGAERLIRDTACAPGALENRPAWRASRGLLLLKALEERIGCLLVRNLEKLMTILYLLNIYEERYKRAMGEPTLGAKARVLAQATLERESEKVLTRKRYAEQIRESLTNVSPS